MPQNGLLFYLTYGDASQPFTHSHDSSQLLISTAAIINELDEKGLTEFVCINSFMIYD